MDSLTAVHRVRGGEGHVSDPNHGTVDRKVYFYGFNSLEFAEEFLHRLTVPVPVVRKYLEIAGQHILVVYDGLFLAVQQIVERLCFCQLLVASGNGVLQQQVPEREIREDFHSALRLCRFLLIFHLFVSVTLFLSAW